MNRKIIFRCEKNEGNNVRFAIELYSEKQTQKEKL